MPVKVNSNLIPRTTGYPLIDDADIKGALHIVADVTARGAIPDYILKVGMLAYTIAEDKYWKLTEASPSVIWEEFASGGGGGLVWKGTWNGVTAYSVNDVVTYIESLYVCVLPNTNAAPNISADWALMSEGGSAATYLSATGAGGQIQIGDLADASDSTTYLEINPTDEGTSFFVSTTGTPNISGTRKDYVIGLGWNLSAGGGRVDASPLNGAIGFLLEQFYINGSGDKTMEFHQVATPPNDVQTRITSTLIGLEAPYSVGHYIYADVISIGIGNDNSDPASILLASTTTTIKSPAGNSGQVLVDDGDHQVKLLGNGAYAQIHLTADGALQLSSGNSQNLTLAYGSSAASVTIGPTGTVLSSNDGTSARIELSDGEGPSISAGGGVVAGFQSSVINFGVRAAIHRGGVNLDPVAGLTIYNATGATNGSQQYSPMLLFQSNGFSESIGGGTSGQMGWYVQSQPVQGSVASVNLVFMKEINEAVSNSGIYFSSDGMVHAIGYDAASATTLIVGDTIASGVRVGKTGGNVGFYGTAPVALQTGVAVDATGIHAALVNLGLITA